MVVTRYMERTEYWPEGRAEFDEETGAGAIFYGNGTVVSLLSYDRCCVNCPYNCYRENSHIVTIPLPGKWGYDMVSHGRKPHAWWWISSSVLRIPRNPF